MKNETFLPTGLYESLPPLLQEPCAYFTAEQDKAVYLLSALTVAGACMYNYHGSYAGNRVYPNINCFIVNADSHTPQPLLAACRLAQKADEDQKTCYEDAVKEYPEWLAEFEADRKLFWKGELKKCPSEPKVPHNMQVLIPAATTHNHLVQLLADKQGQALLYESDGSVFPTVPVGGGNGLVQLINNGFYNQPYTYHYITAKKNVHIPQLKPSVLLSGTYDDLLKPIPNKESVLLNCFNFYINDNTNSFIDPFEEKVSYEEMIGEYYDLIIDLYSETESKDEIIFEMNEEQKRRFVQHYATNLDDTTQHRAITAYRTAMILAMLHTIGMGGALKVSSVACSDADLDTALAITDSLIPHRQEVLNYLNDNGRATDIPTTEAGYTEEQRLIATLHAQGMSLRKIAVELYNDENKFMKVKRTLAAMGRG